MADEEQAGGGHASAMLFPASAVTLDDPSLFRPATVMLPANAQPWDRIDRDL